MAETPPGAPPAASFETCLDELEKVVKELEAGDLSLDRSLELFERGWSRNPFAPRNPEHEPARLPGVAAGSH